MADLKERILDIIRQPHLAAFATVTGEGRPWVRYVMPFADDDLTLRFSTFVSARKVEQIRTAPEVHLTCGVTDPMNFKSYLQIEGRAEFTTDDDERARVWNDHLANIFEGPDDPNMGVVIIRPYRIELNTAGSFEPEIWEA